METKDEIIILAAGDYPTRPELLTILNESQRVICCDSAAEEFVRHTHRLPWRIVGDLDSLSVEKREEYAGIIVHESEQETNDLSKAVRYSVSQGATRIVILGATGRREDHTLGNISLLIDFMHMGLEVVMLTDYGHFVPCSDVFAASLPIGSQLSIFSFGACGFVGSGLRYPLHDFSSWWQGTLNETKSEEVCIRAKGDFLVFVNE